MKDNKFVLGVVGLGEGRSIISAILNSEYYTLGNICDLNEELCKLRCEEFHLERYTTSYEELLRDEAIDIIGIYTPDQFHAAHIRQALLAGKHVICTKPVLLGLTEAKELLECQQKSGKKVFIGQSTRFFESVLQQRKSYEAGVLGELVTLETHYKSDSRWFLDRPWSKKAGFSWMYNFMIHAVDLAVWYLPDIEEVFGYGVVSSNTKEFGLNVEDTLTFLVKDKSGIYATVEGAYATPCLNKEIEFPIECTIRGTKGISRGGYNQLVMYQKSLKDSLPEDKKCYALDAEPEEFFEDKTYRYDDKHPYYFRFEGETHHAGEYQNYIDYFAKALLAGETPLPDLKEGIHTIAIMEAMGRSLHTGAPVKVERILSEYGII
ncbi:MAG TPA: Gfo/Idh/MocA family oxidoreductase [Clostridiales bacterium]|nr:Gfo/Idh/MocA family oxidoreductase [Clostridiales bacterium]